MSENGEKPDRKNRKKLKMERKRRRRRRVEHCMCGEYQYISSTSLCRERDDI